ncbi:MAG: hypothetical protein LBH91_03100 [Prevotellaceae bacterium]|nr:hypothetical protein [Prevotellaceae bacterium]
MYLCNAKYLFVAGRTPAERCFVGFFMPEKIRSTRRSTLRGIGNDRKPAT